MKNSLIYIILSLWLCSCYSASNLRDAESLKKGTISIAHSMEMAGTYAVSSYDHKKARAKFARTPVFSTTFHLGYGINNKLDVITDVSPLHMRAGLKYQILDSKYIDIGLGVYGHSNILNNISVFKADPYLYSMASSYTSFKLKSIKIILNTRFNIEEHLNNPTPTMKRGWNQLTVGAIYDYNDFCKIKGGVAFVEYSKFPVFSMEYEFLLRTGKSEKKRKQKQKLNTRDL